LRTTKENLEDLEQSEIRTMLMRLPNLDVTRVSPVTSSNSNLAVALLKLLLLQIIAQAQNLRHETMERQLYEDGAL
jgi:hypothetical protein